MSILAGLASYYRLGVRGVLAISSYRLIGRPKEITAWPVGIRYPIHLRVRTTDVSIFNMILLREEYDFDLPFYPKTIVDAGANIGLASIYYAHKYPGARIIAIEPETSNFSILSKNVESYSNVVPLQAALWNRDGVVSVSEPDPATGAFDKWGFVTHEGESAGVQVRAITMRTLMTEMRISCVDVLKVDIEGAEKEVFESCDWIENVRSLVIELHDRFRPGCSAAVNSVTRGFSKSQRGEVTFYVRH